MRHAGERPTTGALAIDGGEYVWMGDGLQTGWKDMTRIWQDRMNSGSRKKTNKRGISSLKICSKFEGMTCKDKS